MINRQNLLLTLFTLIGLFILAELSLQIKGFFSDSEPVPRYEIIRHSYHNPFLIFGPDINKELKQNNNEYARWNSQGFRMDEELSIEKEKGEFRIVALGGSTTEDVQNGQNLHYCGLASEAFKNKYPGRNIRCLNAGKSGFTAAHSLIRLETDIIQYKPDIVTVMNNLNDLTVNLYSQDGRTNYGNKFFAPSYSPSLDNKYFLMQILGKFRTVEYIGNKISKAKIVASSRPIWTLSDGTVVTGNSQFSDEAMALPLIETYRSYLRSIAAVGRVNGIRVVFLTEPATFSEAKYYSSFAYNWDGIVYPRAQEFQRAYESYNQVIREVAQETGSGLINLYTQVGHDDKYFVDVVHTNADGVRKVADAYSKGLEQYIK